MDFELHNHGKVLENLRKQLAVSVRSIRWSYSIFWSISSSDTGLLEWSEGYYNGDIKTRKTVQDVEFDVDEMGLQRSQQLRELYESLLTGETNPQAKRPSAALSPEDLSDTEWYYLVCMSFVFSPGQGLPGKTFENGQPFWLSNAHQADSRVFSRSLLAKSASIQTVVCFPFLGGVIELGVTDMVSEDFSLIQCVQASLLGIDCPTLIPNNGFGLIQPVEETEFIIEGVNVDDLIDDELSNCVYTSLTSSECVSQNYINPENRISLTKTENLDEIHPQLHENPEGSCQHQWSDDLHYKNIFETLSKSTSNQILKPYIHNRNKDSCFVSWKTGSYSVARIGYPQRVLKKVLFDVPQMHVNSSKEVKVEGDELASGHVLAERRRRERVNDRFSELKSLIPSLDKADKVSILDDTIKHMKKLTKRVEELETRRDLKRRGVKPQDMVERTSDNYRTRNVGVKRKIGDDDDDDYDDEEKLENSIVTLRDSSRKTNLSISLIQKDISVELMCPWKECLLIEIIDALSNLRIDTHSVQSSTSDNYLSLTIKAKIRGSGRLSAGVIRQVLQRVVMKYE